MRRLSALSGAGIAGLLPTRVLSAAGEEASLTADSSSAATSSPDSSLLQSTSAPASPPLLWDGISGVSKDFFNYGAQLPWQNVGGDWSDAAQVPQGTSAYATITFASAGPATTTITPLVQRWYASGNSGAYLQCTANAGYVASRANSNPALRPVVVLTLSDATTVQLTCSACAVANLTTSYPLTGQTLVVQASSPMLLQFTLPALGARTITKAVLTLNATQIYGTTTLKVFELRPPKIFEGGQAVLGIADRYDHDDNIASDSQVYFATQFDEPNWQGKLFPIGGLDSDSVVVNDADLDTPALAVKYHVGEFSPCYLNHMWSQKVPGIPTTNAAGTLKIYEQITVPQYDTLNNQDCPSEVYFRYYLKLNENYQCAVDGKKLPGLAGRYGYWNSLGTDKGYYQVVNGNGGSPTKGTKITGSAYPGGFYYSGWSMRHIAWAGPTDSNPYGDRVAAGTYAYHAAMTGFYGDTWRWGTSSIGWIIYEPERWYCIEQYVKMNTLSGPYDALGNGVGNADGILRGWIDGVMVFEKKDIVFRKHPAIRVDEIWLSHYHGGVIPAEAEHDFEMANLVVASAYIGPMRGVSTGGGQGPVTGTPLWLQSKPINQWIAITGTGLTASTCAAEAAAGLTDGLCRDIGYGDPRRGIMAYSGGALKKSGSEMLIFGGGGGKAWAGNDIRGLRLEDDAPVWRTLVNPAPVSIVPPAAAPARPYMLDSITPSARHSFWQPQVIDATDTFMAFGCVTTWSGSSGQFYVVDAVPLASGRWDAPGAHPPVPMSRGWDGNWACKHPLTEDVYVSGSRGVSKWSRASNNWSTVWQSTHTDVDRATAAIDPTGGGVLLRIGNFGEANVPVAIDLATGVATVAAFSGPYAAAVNVGGYFAAGLVFDPVLNKFLLFQDDGFLYTITKVSIANWAVNRLALTGVPPTAGHSARVGYPAIWGRMQYVPNLKGVCIIQAPDRPAYFVKTA
jgi:hypothetical protein